LTHQLKCIPPNSLVAFDQLQFKLNSLLKNRNNRYELQKKLLRWADNHQQALEHLASQCQDLSRTDLSGAGQAPELRSSALLDFLERSLGQQRALVRMIREGHVFKS